MQNLQQVLNKLRQPVTNRQRCRPTTCLLSQCSEIWSETTHAKFWFDNCSVPCTVMIDDCVRPTDQCYRLLPINMPRLDPPLSHVPLSEHSTGSGVI